MEAAVKIFECQYCGQLLYFENTVCASCERRLGYLPELGEVSAVEPANGPWRALADSDRPYLFCANWVHDACNWMVPADGPEAYCVACRHNRIVPDLSWSRNLERWKQLEIAKRRLFYTLLRLGLKLRTRNEHPHGLAFDFLADPNEGTGYGPSVLTGHDRGLITINLAEADHVERERRRRDMGEPYRTLVGHFRHEIGHYFWGALVEGDSSLDAFRRIFGDERQDYGLALETYYARGAPQDWQNGFVSAYATAHPWEDFAETWAHYLHIVDTLETAGAFGMHIRPRRRGRVEVKLAAEIDFDPCDAPHLDQLIRAWLPLTFAVNSLNRSMGQFDLYPFMLSPTAIAKLGFVHARIRAASGHPPGESPEGRSDEDVLKAIISGLRYRVAPPHLG
jgi:hypothetical protein